MDAAELQAKATIAAALIVSHVVSIPDPAQRYEGV
jgi:hypothetical protein